MITYSVSHKTNLAGPTQPQKAYDCVQSSKQLNLHPFSYPIVSRHNLYFCGNLNTVWETTVRDVNRWDRMGYKT